MKAGILASRGRNAKIARAAIKGQKIKNAVNILLHYSISGQQQNDTDYHYENIEPDIAVLQQSHHLTGPSHIATQ